MSQLSFASLAFVLFLASNVGVSDSETSGFNALFFQEVLKVNAKLGVLESKMQELTEKLDSNITATDVKFTVLESKIQELTKKLESNTPATADLKIAVLESKIQELMNKFKDYATNANVERLDSDVKELKKESSATNTKVDRVDADIKDLSVDFVENITKLKEDYKDDILQQLRGRATESYVKQQLRGRATESYVKQQLRGRATESYVQQQLRGRATESYVQQQLRGRATESYVQQQLRGRATESYVQQRLRSYATASYVRSHVQYLRREALTARNELKDKLSKGINELGVDLVGNITQLKEDYKDDISQQLRSYARLSYVQNYYARESSVSSIRNRLNSPSVVCYSTYTAWTGRSDAKIMNLDRHNLDCPKPYFLAKFHFRRAGWHHDANVRYEYRCCKMDI